MNSEINIKEMNAFDSFIRSKYGESVLWNNGEPTHPFYLDLWCSWQASAQREGYMVVPKEPTPKMIDVGMGGFCFPLDNGRFSNHDLIFAYRAMLEAVEK